MNIFSILWGSISYVGALYIASALIAFKLKKKQFFVPKILISFILTSIIGHFYNLYFMNYSPYTVTTVFFRSLVCILLFLATLFTVKICYHCTIWEALFCSTSGYCLEHISQRFAALISNLLFPDSSDIVSAIILLLITFLIYSNMFYLIIYRGHYNRIIADSKPQILIGLLVLLIAITLNSTALFLAEQLDSHLLEYHIYIYSILSASLALFIEFALLYQKNAEYDRNILEQLMHENEAQFQIEKNAIDIINIKCHDLKHQLQQSVSSDEFDAIQSAVNNYDFIFHTENQALDTVLTMKSLQCEKKHIILTCMGNGAFLSFISDADIYSLFGNILDNAIEAVELIENRDKRLIGLTITTQSGFVFVHAENYYNGIITYQNGLPETHKSDKQFHGFGIHSIKLITDKYHGSCHFSDNNQIFTIDIALPIHSGDDK